MSLSSNFPTIKPSLNLDFVNVGALDPRITFTRASTATYFNGNGVLTTSAINAARFDYDPTTLEAKGLLIEEQRTNLFTYSADFSNAAWAKTRSSITSNTIVAPDGTLTGDKLVEDTTSSNNHILRVNSQAYTSGTTYTFSFYLKAAERRYAYFQFRSSAFTGNQGAVFDLVSGVVVSNGASAFATVSISNAGNGWWRIAATATATSTYTGIEGFYIYLMNGDTVGTSTVYTGDGTSGIYIWGAQLEAGAFATSYIPTSTAAVTRSADVASINTLSPWYNAAAGTLYAECSIPFDASTSLFPLIAGFSDGTFNNAITQYERTVDDTRRAVIRVGGSGLFEITNGGTYIYGATSKQALAFAVGDAAFSVNGTAPSTATPASLPTVNIMGLGSTNFLGGSLNMLNGHLRRIAYYPSRLTNAQLQALTS